MWLRRTQTPLPNTVHIMSILTHTATIEKFTTMYIESYEAEQDFISANVSTGLVLVFRLTQRTADIVRQLEAQNGTGNWGDVSNVEVTFNPGRLTPEVNFDMNGQKVCIEFLHSK